MSDRNSIVRLLVVCAVAVPGVCLLMFGLVATCWVIASRHDIGGYFLGALATALTILGSVRR